jgi:uncharacterized protein YodC (DUF2158 family)
MSNQIKAGDVVQLNSGGPKMTVSWIDELGNAWCVWFDNAKQQGASFPLTSLKYASA